ncbi:DUF4214 domain-containing protein [Marivita sp. S6314]|uniref:DUF4214 domain-containing protein n=1 Tax=Marivita sp. S6314 TaxID=2926406 RepID=UPI001FF5FF71|nr:DUF4214 domain-containing protein [Marivita sp. S6314]MCK0151012.1 DUF4214 domain-containing protein [Marivita sp. S6314]
MPIFNGTPFADIIPGTQATYANLNDNTAFAQQVYQNVLGRAFDADGLAFWVSALDTGGVSKPAFILEMLKGAKAPPSPGASQDFITQQLIDQEYLALKTNVGAEFAVERGMSNVENARTVMSIYDGSAFSVQNAVSQSEIYFQNEQSELNGAFLIQLVGVIRLTQDDIPQAM